MAGLIGAIGAVSAGMIGAGVIAVEAPLAVEVTAGVTVEIAAGVGVEIAAEAVADVLRHIGVEGMAPEADQGHDELEDQDGPAQGGADDEYGSHLFNPQNTENASALSHLDFGIVDAKKPAIIRAKPKVQSQFLTVTLH